MYTISLKRAKFKSYHINCLFWYLSLIRNFKCIVNSLLFIMTAELSKFVTCWQAVLLSVGWLSPITACKCRYKLIYLFKNVICYQLLSMWFIINCYQLLYWSSSAVIWRGGRYEWFFEYVIMGGCEKNLEPHICSLKACFNQCGTVI